MTSRTYDSSQPVANVDSNILDIHIIHVVHKPSQFHNCRLHLIFLFQKSVRMWVFILIMEQPDEISRFVIQLLQIIGQLSTYIKIIRSHSYCIRY